MQMLLMVMWRNDDWWNNDLTCVEEDDPEGSTGAHLSHQSQAQSDPVKLLRDKAGSDTGDSTQDLTEGEDWTTVSDVDGE